MNLQRLHIKNFKSIVDLEIVEPNPFTVFVGPNGSGKSNIFEALEFWNLSFTFVDIILGLFGSKESITFSQDFFKEIKILVNTENTHLTTTCSIIDKVPKVNSAGSSRPGTNEYDGILNSFLRLFVGNKRIEKLNFSGDNKLSTSASNLEKVLKRILLDETKREEIKEWLDLFIPGFENIEIVSSDLSGTDTLVMYEKGMKKPFTKGLLSDGTYNILALLTAVYQSDEPQFLCIEEPENGLTPYVIEQFVELFRNACQEKGHYIWLNTHSPTLVRHLRADELIVVDKKQGATQIKQFKGKDYFGLRMDEAWLTNALGGGLPW